MPTLSHAVVTRIHGSQAWVELCTVTGMAWVQVDDAKASDDQGDGQDSPSSSSKSSSRCDWCATHAPSSPMLESSHPALRVSVAPKIVPDAFLHAPRPLFAWASAQSRAPPLHA